MLGGLFGWKKRSIGKTGEKLPGKHEGLPDSTYAYGLCPRFQKQSSFEIAGTLPVTFNPDSYGVGLDGTHTPVHVDQVGVTASGEALAAAIEKTYSAVAKIRFDGMQYRKDIGAKGLKRWALPSE